MVRIQPLLGEVPMPVAARSREGIRSSSCSKYSLILQVSVTDHSQKELRQPNHSSSVLRAKAGVGHSFGNRGVRRQWVPGVKTPGLGVAEVSPIKQGFRARIRSFGKWQFSLIHRLVL